MKKSSIMLKYVVAIVLIAGFSLYVSIQYKQHAEHAASKAQQPSSEVSGANNDENAQSNVQQSKWNPPRWYRLFSWPDGTQVWALFLTLLVIAEQTSQTGKAAEAASVAAVASLRQSEHTVASERAWIMADLYLRPGAMPVTHTTDALGNDITHVVADLTIRNSGSTPAWVFKQWVRIELSPVVLASMTEYEAPDIPYGKGIEGADRTGGVSHVSSEILPLLKEDTVPHVFNTELQVKGRITPANHLILYIYGMVEYRDAFSSSRRTYFGYSLREGVLWRIPSEAYNRHE